jgi:lipoprotein signal peptidase
LPAVNSAARREVWGLLCAALVLAADQGSKHWILTGLDLPARHVVPVLPPLLDLAMVWNNGVTFGLMQAGSPLGVGLLITLAVIIICGLAFALLRAERIYLALCYGAIGGGAVGNVIDRLHYGRVVDFIHVHWGSFDPFPFVFNVGDSAIVVGVALLLLDSFLSPPPGLPNPPPAA